MGCSVAKKFQFIEHSPTMPCSAPSLSCARACCRVGVCKLMLVKLRSLREELFLWSRPRGCRLELPSSAVHNVVENPHIQANACEHQANP